VTLACAAKSAVILDPMNGSVGIAALNQTSGQAQVYLQLQPGESVMLRVFANRKIDGPAWNYWRPAGPGGEIKGGWQVEFISGGPTLPAPLETTKLASWTEQGDTNAQSFAGTTRYSITFDAPDPHSGPWQLDLGDVRQSARVQLNSRDYGTLITPPFRVTVDNLKPAGNQLEVEVTGVSANRIRDLDRRGVPWKNFRDINFVDIDYKPFNAANWPLIDSGLLGPVTLTAVAPVQVR
jgi:hypothetical protein